MTSSPGLTRGGQDDLVAGVDQGPQGLIDAGLGAVGHHHLAGLVLHAAVRLHPLADGLPQLQSAGGGSVFGIVVQNGGHSGQLDVVRGGEVGLAGAEADHVLSLRLHLLEHGVNGHGAGGLYAQGQLGKFFHTKNSSLSSDWRV